MNETIIIPIARRYAGVVLVSTNNEFILQRRDNKKGIVNPGLITPFGGSCKSEEHTQNCAIREIQEELNYQLLPEKLSFLTHFLKQEKDGSYTYMHFYSYNEKIDAKRLNLSEGEGIELTPLEKDVSAIENYSAVCKRVINEFKTKG